MAKTVVVVMVSHCNTVLVNTACVVLQLMCCGAINFTDYELVFNNMSVPLSCCNFTNPLVNMTTCPEIISNAAPANQSGLIYAEVRLIHMLYVQKIQLIIIHACI